MSELQSNGECTVTVRKDGADKHYPLRKGFSFQALAARQSTALEFNCRAADCGVCIVKVRAGKEQLSPPKANEQDFLTAMHADPDERLACQCRVYGAVTVEIEF